MDDIAHGPLGYTGFREFSLDKRANPPTINPVPRRKKIILQTNAPWMKTGLAENGRILMNWLAKRDKYDLVYYCQQVADVDPNLARMPYKCYGAVPSSEQTQLLHLKQHDAARLQLIMYGSRFIDEIIRKERPDIWIGSDDVWSFNSQYFQSEWFKRISSVLHITVDSVPVLDQAYEQALSTKYFRTWAAFAGPEMVKKRGAEFSHVSHLYGASDTTKFRPTPKEQKAQLRKTFGIDQNATVFISLGRNQLRKEYGQVIQAFAAFKRDNPSANAKLLFHTSFSPQELAGWNIPKLTSDFGVKTEDILCTMFCRQCGAWEVVPYKGEDADCRFCGTKKSQCSTTPDNGVSNDELHLVYGIADASISAFTSGGLEYTNVASLLCGLPLACTNYSCGEDFCAQPFVTPIKWLSRIEHNTSFVKATNDINSIRGFIEKIHRMPEAERAKIGAQGREWAAKEFHIDTIGPKWEALFDSMPEVDWSTIHLEYQPKNPSLPMPQDSSTEAFVRALYKGILLVDPDPKGLSDWMGWIDGNAMTRTQVWQQFLQIAHSDNVKNSPLQDFGAQLDKTTGKRRGIIVIKESIGDALMVSSLFESFHEQYLDHDLYVGTSPQYVNIFAGNPHVKKVLIYNPIMEQEMAMIGAGQTEGYFHVYMHPAIGSQRVLNYLSNSHPRLP